MMKKELLESAIRNIQKFDENELVEVSIEVTTQALNTGKLTLEIDFHKKVQMPEAESEDK